MVMVWCGERVLGERVQSPRGCGRRVLSARYPSGVLARLGAPLGTPSGPPPGGHA
jgi:hypothetical protein